jgi:hypothetical protein
LRKEKSSLNKKLKLTLSEALEKNDREEKKTNGAGGRKLENGRRRLHRKKDWKDKKVRTIFNMVKIDKHSSHKSNILDVDSYEESSS